MKKRTSLVLALGLTMGSVLPIAAAANTIPYNVMVQKESEAVWEGCKGELEERTSCPILRLWKIIN
ncbi:hypothetical protein [Neobacillus sp. 19]|uniref:hypothetical protein n=1 Tax=Neobacillus sp. 19 TaxID=3394458 RepID=UPI003BF6281A